MWVERCPLTGLCHCITIQPECRAGSSNIIALCSGVLGSRCWLDGFWLLMVGSFWSFLVGLFSFFGGLFGVDFVIRPSGGSLCSGKESRVLIHALLRRFLNAWMRAIAALTTFCCTSAWTFCLPASTSAASFRSAASFSALS